MNQERILDAFWRVCEDLARRDQGTRNRQWNRDRVLREASGCVLASQVPHAMAVAALGRLGREGLLPRGSRPPCGARIVRALRSPLSRSYPRAYRFPEMARTRLVRLASSTDELVDAALHESDLRIARRRLVRLGCGLGPKQASLLLRNIRQGAPLAVLDVHLLAFMRVADLTPALAVPTRLGAYEILEQRLGDYACGLGVPMCRLDVAAWIVMRAARAKGATWLL